MPFRGQRLWLPDALEQHGVGKAPFNTTFSIPASVQGCSVRLLCSVTGARCRRSSGLDGRRSARRGCQAGREWAGPSAGACRARRVRRPSHRLCLLTLRSITNNAAGEALWLQQRGSPSGSGPSSRPADARPAHNPQHPGSYQRRPRRCRPLPSPIEARWRRQKQQHQPRKSSRAPWREGSARTRFAGSRACSEDGGGGRRESRLLRFLVFFAGAGLGLRGCLLQRRKQRRGRLASGRRGGRWAESLVIDTLPPPPADRYCPLAPPPPLSGQVFSPSHIPTPHASRSRVEHHASMLQFRGVGGGVHSGVLLFSSPLPPCTCWAFPSPASFTLRLLPLLVCLGMTAASPFLTGLLVLLLRRQVLHPQRGVHSLAIETAFGEKRRAAR